MKSAVNKYVTGYCWFGSSLCTTMYEYVHWWDMRLTHTQRCCCQQPSSSRAHRRLRLQPNCTAVPRLATAGIECRESHAPSICAFQPEFYPCTRPSLIDQHICRRTGFQSDDVQTFNQEGGITLRCYLNIQLLFEYWVRWIVLFCCERVEQTDSYYSPAYFVCLHFDCDWLCKISVQYFFLSVKTTKAENT